MYYNRENDVFCSDCHFQLIDGADNDVDVPLVDMKLFSCLSLFVLLLFPILMTVDVKLFPRHSLCLVPDLDG